MRKQLAWTRRQLATHTGISERFLADVEAGRANPSLLRLQALARGLGTTAAALLATVPEPGGSPGRRAIALLGLRGAGKSSVGAMLATALGRELVELDARVEQIVGLSLAAMFELHGEAYYRRVERRALRELLGSIREPIVLATGGGLVTAPETFQLLQEHTHTVWLRARPEDHWRRVVAQGDLRPMADDEQAFAHLGAILAEREQLYCQAGLVVDTSNRTVGEVTDELVARFATLARSEKKAARGSSAPGS